MYDFKVNFERGHLTPLGTFSVNHVRVPRWTGQCRSSLIELHGFADASSRAYAAVLYLRVSSDLVAFRTCFISAKSKVAPLKTVSIPRLELNAVVLLSRLIRWCKDTLQLGQIPTYGWTDSTVVLAWLRQHPSRWATYVANRVSEVQTRTPAVRWHHVASAANPADCASRGQSSSELLRNSLWWQGPSWLAQPASRWPRTTEVVTSSEETDPAVDKESRKSVVLHVAAQEDWDLVDKYSSWSKLVRVTAYLRRFISLLAKRAATRQSGSPTISLTEYREAENFWLRYLQAKFFAKELSLLRDKQSVSRSSPLSSLSPMLGEDGFLRLGGRLHNAALSYAERHPVILPRHRLTKLLIAQTHSLTLHGGVQLMLRALRQRFWLLSGRSMAKQCVHRCAACVRHSFRQTAQLMGDLLSARVRPSPPFTHTGVDYAGPFHLIPFVGRGQKARKAYVAVFVCLTTRAIHLECVEDGTTDGFLAALRRFASRRGAPRHLYSDNGTNFRGADRELRSLVCSLQESASQAFFHVDGVEWHFCPPSAPHFGGLWEAAVKSFKAHLTRVAGARTLSRTEFSTLLCQIEACLNSRPISTLKDDPTELSALTPGHFLIGRPLIALPEESALELEPSRLSRWQLVNAMQESFWRSWAADYLNSLQQRSKWRSVAPNLSVHDVVVVKNPLLPPCRWELARVLRVHTGDDGVVRVATIRTATSEYRRPVARLCRLPTDSEDELAAPAIT